MTQPAVSVMMPAYNAAEFIAQAIESVLAQSFHDWELIIVDDGSRDDTYAIAAGYQDPRIRIIRQENGGEAVARNTALRHMRGELVAFLDADDLFLPDHLALTVAYLQANPQHDAVYSDGFYCNTQGERLKPLSTDRRGPFSGDIFEEVVRASDVFGPPTCVLLRRNLITQHDLQFDPEIVIGPDWDFMTRYSEQGQFGAITAHTCLYRVHQTNVTLRVDRRRRALYLARCREKAIQLQRFPQCSLATRRDVFYDLLVVQLTGYPERQDEITTWAQFKALPAAIQAQLLRLMATEALLADPENDSTPQPSNPLQGRQPERWLRRARRMHPTDWRSALLLRLAQISPSLLQRLLRMRRRRTAVSQPSSPFANAT